MERLWSYLRRLAKTTKEMRPAHRIDILTSGMIHYGSKRVTLLPKRMSHAKEILKKSLQDLQTIQTTKGG